jgi:protein-S-isoprenylcysteine O-methyltransferase Ste14
VNRGLFALHLLFWSPFAVRGVLRALRASRVKARGRSAAAFASERTRAARALPAKPLLAHGIGFVLLFLACFQADDASAWERTIGFGLILVAAAMATWTLAVFRSWKLDARLDTHHTLATTGPFRLVRHPVYLAFDLLALGTFVWAGGPLAFVAVLVIAYAGDRRARIEERALVAAFGDRYRSFMGQVSRFLPGLY